ncbi:DUF3418 domain-containing protein [Neisseria meningitidis]|nr:DUF3418 domain-containing protein [Neisseria meningitidis]
MDARSNPANVSDGLQNSSGHIGTNTRYRLTKLGEQIARLPIDPKIARILLAAKKHDCMAEILVIASALSIQDPRERPLEARDASAKAHERFTDKQSDFLAYLNIWDSFQRERDKGLSNKQLVQWCRQYFLSHLRMREWRELHHQLAQTAIEMGLTTKEAAFRRPPEVRQLTSSENAGDQDLSAKLKQKQLDKKQHRAQIRAAKEAGYEQIHRALLTGLIANVGMKSPDGNDYTGARGSRFHLFPASALFKAKPKWVMAAELVETTRLYARDVAVIQPEWIEQEAPHLVRYHYFEPHWEQKRGEVVASERVTLYGLTVLPRRPVSYGKVAPEEAREIFIRSALVAQECDLKADFFVHNKKLIKEITELEHKSRKQDVLVDDEALFAFYNERLPEMAWKDAQGSVWGSEDSVRIIESDKAERSSENERNEFRKNKRNGSRQNENHGNTVGWVENPTSAATAKTVGFDNPTYAAQQTTPSPVGEGRGEGKTVAAQTNFSATAANPLPNPLPQEREQSAAASTISDDLRPANLQQTAPSPVGEGWGEGKTVATQTNFSATSTLSDDSKPKKQPAPQKNRLKPLPLADIRTFQAWLKTAERDNPRLLFLSRDDLMQHAAAHITEEQFPKFWQTADGKFKLSYRFEPHHPLDGVTMTVPLTVLNRLHAPSLEWLVPGMIREKIQLQIKALPKQIRRICVPVPEFITQFLSQNPDRNAPILPQLAQAIAKTAGDIRIFEQINQDEWAAFRLPEHCYFNLRIIDDGGQELAGGRKLHELQQQLGQAAAVTFRDNTQEFERDNVTAWDIGTLPESIKFARGKQQLTGYLGLQKEKDGRRPAPV